MKERRDPTLAPPGSLAGGRRRKDAEMDVIPRYDVGVRDQAFHGTWWLIWCLLLGAYAAVVFSVGPALDDLYVRDVSDVLKVNYHARREAAQGRLPWVSYEKREVQRLYPLLKSPPEAGHQEHAWTTTTPIVDDDKSNPDAKEKTRKEKKTRRDGTEAGSGSTAEAAWASATEWGREAMARTSAFRDDATRSVERWAEERRRCEDLPLAFDPTVDDPYYVDDLCERMRVDALSPETRDAELDRLFPGERARRDASGRAEHDAEGRTVALEAASRWDLFFTGSVRAHCARYALQYRGDSEESDLFVLYAALENALCNRVCASAMGAASGNAEASEERERLRGRLSDLRRTNPWLLIDAYRGNDTLLRDAERLLRMTSPSAKRGDAASERPRVREIGGDLPSWSYGCDLRNAVLRHGGAVAVIDVPWEMFVNYRDGVYAYRRLGSVDLPRQRVAVLIVGWGVGRAEDGRASSYFLAAPPFGAEWGRRGYVRIEEGEIFLRDETRRTLMHGLVFDP